MVQKTNPSTLYTTEISDKLPRFIYQKRDSPDFLAPFENNTSPFEELLQQL